MSLNRATRPPTLFARMHANLRATSISSESSTTTKNTRWLSSTVSYTFFTMSVIKFRPHILRKITDAIHPDKTAINIANRPYNALCSFANLKTSAPIPIFSTDIVLETMLTKRFF